MDKNLLQKAKAPMMALIHLKNIMENKMKRAFVLLLLLGLMMPVAMQAQDFGNLSRAINECRKPTQLTVSQITANSAQLSWTENGDADTWIVAYRTDDDDDFNEVITAENPYNLTGLTPETYYIVKVSPYCEWERWSNEIAFITLESCPAPTGLQVDNMTATTATLSWTGFSQDYVVRYRTSIYKGERGATAGEWETLSATEPTITLTNLMPETTYEAQVQGDCGDEGPSEFSETITFTTGLFDGSGTEEDPYIIATTDDMDELASQVNNGNNYSGTYFLMTADLDYSGKTYTPVGNEDNPFKGHFDGNFHSISNVVINAPGADDQGLFGYIGIAGTVANLVIGSGSSITGFYYVGGIAGGCAGSITGCIVSEGVTITGNSKVGGIVGDAEGHLSWCVNKASVSGSSQVVGGIAGLCIYSTLSNNLNLGAVSGSDDVGGILGYYLGVCTFSNNYYAGNCTVGGIDNSDVAGQAMRGYKIEPQDPLVINLEGSIGVAYEGNVYAGNEQSVVVGLNTPITPQCYILSAGTLVDNGNDTLTITMPAEDITIGGNIVEFYGTYYEIPCNGDTTATVIYDDSYLTLEHVDIEDFEYLGKQYTVTAIADGAFDGCDSIIYFDCHSNISTIGDHAMRNCTGIDYFGFYHTPTPPTLGEGVFEGLSLDTLWLMVPFCSQYDYSTHPVWGQFGTVFPDGECEYNFINMGGDKLWSNPDNWAEGEVPVAGAQVGIMSDCVIDTVVTVGSITIGYYIDEEWGYYERLTVRDSATLTATSYIYNTGDERNFIIEDGAQVVHPNAGAKATVQKAVSAYSTQSGVNNGWHLIALPLTGSIDVDSVGNMIGGEYDLYAYDESTAYWKNSKNTENSFTALEATKGYLYAHGEDVTLEFSGTLQNSSDTISVPLSYTEGAHLKGFNLVGNPFPCEAYLDRAYYVLSANGTDINPDAIQGNVPIPPCTAVFVKALTEGDSVVFTRVAP